MPFSRLSRSPSPPPAIPPATAAPAAKPESTCPCDDYKFKPLNDKASAVAEYWAARRKYKSTSGVAGVFGLFAIIARDAGAMQEAQNVKLKKGVNVSLLTTYRP